MQPIDPKNAVAAMIGLCRRKLDELGAEFPKLIDNPGDTDLQERVHALLQQLGKTFAYLDDDRLRVIGRADMVETRWLAREQSATAQQKARN